MQFSRDGSIQLPDLVPKMSSSSGRGRWDASHTFAAEPRRNSTPSVKHGAGNQTGSAASGTGQLEVNSTMNSEDNVRPSV